MASYNKEKPHIAIIGAGSVSVDEICDSGRRLLTLHLDFIQYCRYLDRNRFEERAEVRQLHGESPFAHFTSILVIIRNS